MEKYRILFVVQEMDPYLILGQMADIVRRSALSVQDNDMEIRVLMPRFGVINERRNRLHEVVRLSGINIVIDGDDYPLIIKVASLPGARIQIYFLDNEEFFKRKAIFVDEKEEFFEDNAERLVFFCKGVLDTVKKFGWPPHLIHCHGWMTSLMPMYLKTLYAKDPVFSTSKVVYSLYKEDFTEKMSGLSKIARISDDLQAKDLELITPGDFLSLSLSAATHADALIIGDEQVSHEAEIKKVAGEKPILPFESSEAYLQQYIDFYKMLLN